MSSKASLEAMARESKSKKNIAKPKQVAKRTPPPTFRSSELVADSSDEDEKEDSDEDSSDDQPSAKPVSAMAKVNGIVAGPEGSSSSSSSGSESENESEESDKSSDNDEEDSAKEAARVSPAAVTPSKQSAKEPTTKAVTFKVSAPYEPPAGFELVSLVSTSATTQAFKKSALEGKQIWYFTAPASVPISSIVEMSLRAAENGKAIVNHKGNEYGFMRDSAEDKTYTKIMVPSSSDDGYKLASRPIDQVFHLQQLMHNPTTENLAKATVPAKKPVRQQPKGLKMRFQPIGFGTGSAGNIGSSSDEEMDDGAALPDRTKTAAKPSSDSSSDSDSDSEMKDTPPTEPLPSIKARKSSSHATSAKEMSKRKHGGGGEKKSKHSSSSVMSNIDHRELKRLKKKQTGSQNRADSLSASIDQQKLSTSPISSPKPLTFSQPSGLKHSQSSEKPKSKKEHRKTPMTASPGEQLSLQDLTRATDPSLNVEERRKKKMKKLKRQSSME